MKPPAAYRFWTRQRSSRSRHGHGSTSLLQRDEGVNIDEKTIRKHPNDVARLLQLVSASAQYALPGPVAEDMRAFIDQATNEANFDPRQFKVNVSRADAADRLRAAYGL